LVVGVDLFGDLEDEAPLVWSPTTQFPPMTTGEREPGPERSGKGGSGRPNHRVRYVLDDLINGNFISNILRYANIANK
jgi:hypothetical protein